MRFAISFGLALALGAMPACGRASTDTGRVPPPTNAGDGDAAPDAHHDGAPAEAGAAPTLRDAGRAGSIPDAVAPPDAAAPPDARAEDVDAAACLGTASTGLRSALSRIAGTTRGCFERLLVTDASVGGKLVVSVTIEPDGGSTQVSIVSDTGLGADLEECVLLVFGSASLAGFAPSDRCITVEVPISFAPALKG